jgi:hypothetical protein
MAIDRLTIEDYSDREFLLIVRDVCAESSDGWTEAEEVAERMGLRHKRLEGLDEGKLLMAVRLITERTQEQTGASKLVQREWRYGHARGR